MSSRPATKVGLQSARSTIFENSRPKDTRGQREALSRREERNSFHSGLFVKDLHPSFSIIPLKSRSEEERIRQAGRPPLSLKWEKYIYFQLVEYYRRRRKHLWDRFRSPFDLALLYYVPYLKGRRSTESILLPFMGIIDSELRVPIRRVENSSFDSF